MDNQYNYYVPNEQENKQNNDNVHKAHQSKMKMPKAIMVIALALLFGVVSSATFLASNVVGSKLLGLGSLSGGSKSANAASTVDNTSLTQTSNAVTSDVSEIAGNVMPSVVSITNMSVQQVQNFFGQSGEQEVESTGSGIIIGQNDTELLIVTNNHVIADSETLTVSFIDESSVEADVKGSDAALDIAVVAVPLNSISDDTMGKIKVATLGDSTKLQVGEPAIAIGNALGYGQSVTTGIVSATDRVLTDSESDTAFIQTDAAINPGNSGGALVNANGEVIGINSAKLSDTTVEGMGYAIPISDVSEAITNLMNQETKTKVAEADKGYLGIQGVDVTQESAERYSMPTGVYVSEPISGGGAESAGITKGCIITGINGTTIDSMATLQGELAYYAKGTTVSITMQVPGNGGEYQEKTVDVTLGEQPKQ
ncbi:S1C family serine protease [Hespellia stercorisuis]|uniref:Serine protease Do n=1 Tax=Hespellia stercorisuis DSM 15480 TaxID=1121950 RepID=A0A1M6Q744_9FIRM|nr:trypsin-like peptidase domain-containing protein [Hespellia stercorisuis]SHK15960.1 serine protease Do [Hespellia stercorisuis DSM 15480]